MALLRTWRFYLYAALMTLVRVCADEEAPWLEDVSNGFYTDMAFYEVQRTEDSSSATLGLSLRLFIHPDNRTCWNLLDLVNNDNIAGNFSNSSSSLQQIYGLDGIFYLRSAEDYNADRPYTQWYVNQHPIIGNGHGPGPTQFNIYGESDCQNKTHLYYSHSCRQAAGGNRGDWRAKSISLEPNNVNAATCFYNVSNGVEWNATSAEVSEESGAGGLVRGISCAVAATVAIAFGLLL